MPRNPNSIDVWPAGAFITVLGTNIGLTKAGPSVSRVEANCKVTSVAPKAVPRMIPVRSRFPSVILIPASSSAIRADAAVIRAILSIRRKFFTEMKSRGVKLVTSAPRCDGKVDVSKDLIVSIAESPAKSLRPNSSLPIPSGVTMPIPVITTRIALSICLFLSMTRPCSVISAKDNSCIVASKGEGIGKNGSQIRFS